MMVRPAANTPQEPIPPSALPIIKIILFGAIADKKEPTENIANANKYDNLISKTWSAFPHVGWRAVPPKRYAAPYHDASSNL